MQLIESYTDIVGGDVKSAVCALMLFLFFSFFSFFSASELTRLQDCKEVAKRFKKPLNQLACTVESACSFIMCLL